MAAMTKEEKERQEQLQSQAWTVNPQSPSIIKPPKAPQPSRPEITKSTIIIDDDTGQQVAAITERGKSEADIIRISPSGLRTSETVRGASGYVRQEIQRVKTEEYPKNISSTDKDMKEVSDIERQLSSGLVRQDKQQELLERRDSLLRRQAQPRLQTEGFTSKPTYNEGMTSKPTIQEGMTNRPSSRPVRGGQEFDLPIKRINQVKNVFKSVWDYNARKDNPELVGSSPFALLSPAGGGTVKVASTAKSAAPKLYAGFETIATKSYTKFPKLSRAVTGTATSFGVYFATKKTGQVTRPNVPDINQSSIYSKGFQEETNVAVGVPSDASWIKRHISPKALAREWLPLGTLIIGDKKVYEQSIRQQLESYPQLTEQQKESLVKQGLRERRYNAYAEAVGLIGIERTAESIGRKNVMKEFSENVGQELPKKAGQFFYRVGKRIAVAGSFEGAAGEVVQRQARGEKVTFGNVAFGAGAGAVTGGLIGGAIPTRQIYYGKGKVINVLANVADPYEIVGDKAQDLTEKTFQRYNKMSYLQPEVKTVNGVKTYALGQGTTRKQGMAGIRTGTKTFTASQQTSQKQTLRTFNDLVGSDTLGGKTRGFVTGTKSPTISQQKQINQINIAIDKQNKQFDDFQYGLTNKPPKTDKPSKPIETQQEQKTTAPSFNVGIPTYANVPTVVAGRGFMPPFGVPIGQEYGKPSGRERPTQLYNELNRVATQLFGTLPVQKPKRKSKSKRKSSRNNSKRKRFFL